MTTRRRGVIASASLAALLGVAGCGASASSSTAGPRVPGAAVLTGRVEPVHQGSLSAARVAAMQTAFGFALFDNLCTAAPATNVTVSPASAAEALGMLDAGSVGATRAAVGRLLHLPDWSRALVAALHAQSQALGRVTQVTVTNHVFEQAGISPSSQTLDDLRTAYDADLRQVNFADEPAATDEINAVISHDTDRLIPALFGQPLDRGTRTVLADAILLDAKWRVPFPTAEPGVFHSAGGTPVTTPMMQNTEGEFARRSADGWTSVVLPYIGNLQAVAMLPPQVGAGASAAAQCATPSAATLAALTGGASQGAGVVLPKLDLSQSLSLTRVLAAMGLPLGGDYSGLGAGDSQISQVVQKVVMKVDRAGTKAAAATGVAIGASARVGSQTVSFDRPFLLLLEDTTTHTPLFLARVADPTQQ